MNNEQVDNKQVNNIQMDNTQKSNIQVDNTQVNNMQVESTIQVENVCQIDDPGGSFCLQDARMNDVVNS